MPIHSSSANTRGSDSAVSSPRQSEAGPRRPLLLIGDDLGWLAGKTELAGRKVILADPQADALAYLTAEPLDGVVASYTDINASIALLQTAAAMSPGTLGLLRANGKELGASRPPFPILPRMDSAEVLDDHIRTQLVSATWHANPAFGNLVKMITQIPTQPTLYMQITTALQSPDVSVDDIAELVAHEPAVTAKLLQLVNSPLLALRGRVTSVRDATSLLGLSRLRSLVLATCLFRQFNGSKCPSFSMAKFEATSLKIATWASAIAKGESRDKQVADMAFTASLLHNFGVLLLAANLPEAYDQVLRKAKEQRVSIAWTELEVFGATHAEVAGAILASWGIPFSIVNAVGWYPLPSASEDTTFSPLTAVHAATAVDTYEQTGMFSYDQRYMERLRMEEKVKNWCATLPSEALAA